MPGERLFFTCVCTLPLCCDACTDLRQLFLRLIHRSHDGCGVLLAQPAQVTPRLSDDYLREEELPQSAKSGVSDRAIGRRPGLQ